jgi:hypothetical protein
MAWNTHARRLSDTCKTHGTRRMTRCWVGQVQEWLNSLVDQGLLQTSAGDDADCDLFWPPTVD